VTVIHNLVPNITILLPILLAYKYVGRLGGRSARIAQKRGAMQELT